MIKIAKSRKDPTLDKNQKHVTVNEMINDTEKRKQKQYKVSQTKSFVSYKEGQYEKIFGKK